MMKFQSTPVSQTSSHDWLHVEPLYNSTMLPDHSPILPYHSPQLSDSQYSTDDDLSFHCAAPNTHRKIANLSTIAMLPDYSPGSPCHSIQVSESQYSNDDDLNLICSSENTRKNIANLSAVNVLPNLSPVSPGCSVQLSESQYSTDDDHRLICAALYTPKKIANLATIATVTVDSFADETRPNPDLTSDLDWAVTRPDPDVSCDRLHMTRPDPDGAEAVSTIHAAIYTAVADFFTSDDTSMATKVTPLATRNVCIATSSLDHQTYQYSPNTLFGSPSLCQYPHSFTEGSVYQEPPSLGWRPPCVGKEDSTSRLNNYNNNNNNRQANRSLKSHDSGYHSNTNLQRLRKKSLLRKLRRMRRQRHLLQTLAVL